MKSPVVLYVDDDHAIRELYTAALGRHGFDVIAVSDGPGALTAIRFNDEIAAVVLDYEMPGMNGLELASQLKTHDPALPIVMVSSLCPEWEQLSPHIDLAMTKGGPLRDLVDGLELLLLERAEESRKEARLPC